MHDTPGPAPRQRGFTLIEAMIVVALIAILAAIGYPSYVDHIRRGQLPEAFSALADYRVKMEQYFLDHRNYGESSGACAQEATASAWNNFKPEQARYFDYTCASTGTGFVITAQGRSGRAVGHTYTIDERGRRQTAVFKGQVLVGKACWLVGGSEC